MYSKRGYNLPYAYAYGYHRAYAYAYEDTLDETAF